MLQDGLKNQNSTVLGSLKWLHKIGAFYVTLVIAFGGLLGACLASFGVLLGLLSGPFGSYIWSINASWERLGGL